LTRRLPYEYYLEFTQQFFNSDRFNSMRYGQAFIYYLAVDHGIKNTLDPELFYATEVKDAEQIIVNRYVIFD